jgi:hypothetical protein
MRHENYPTETLSSGRASFVCPRAVVIETPGHYGSGFVTLPSCGPIKDQWPGRELSERLVLEGVVQIMGAVLASDRRDPVSNHDLPYLVREFEEVEFKSPLDPSRDVQVVVRVQTRYGAMSRGIFVAFQGAYLIAAGKLVLRGSKLL